MKIVKIPLEDCTVIKLTELLESGNAHKQIEQLLLRSLCGCVFVTTEADELLGVYSIENYKNNSDAQLKKIPYVYADHTSQSINEQVLLILNKNPFYSILPVVTKDENLTGAVACTASMWDRDKISNLAYLSYLQEKKMDIGCYFRSKRCSKIAFWGVDPLSLTFANTLRHCQDITVAGIYDNSKSKKYCKEAYLNYETEICFVDSLEEMLVASQADFVIITDPSMRFTGNLQLLKEYPAKLIYCNALLQSLDFKKTMNTFLFLTWKAKLKTAGIDCISVRIPTEHDLMIKNPKHGNLSQKERDDWFAKENGWNPKGGGEEVKEFNAARYAFQTKLIKSNGQLYYGDYKSKYINFINKTRVILNDPASFDHTVYLLGPCIAISLFNQDKDTLGFYLQQYFNESHTGYRVIALGTSNDADRYYFFNLLRELELQKGDIVFWLEQTFKCSQWDLDTISVFKNLYAEHGREFYYDSLAHCGREANQKLARFLFDHVSSRAENESAKNVPAEDISAKDISAENVSAKDISAENIFTADPVFLPESGKPKITSNPFTGNPQLEKYKRFVQSEAIHKRQTVGAIVMNCNPFTLGHQYLVEYAACKVDYLYIFVVEEDKSFFNFKDRIELVKAGTRHLPNVKVLPSGEFIISSNTFSEYFDKANLKGTAIDTSIDVETFATQIAPCLDIKVRFVGEEPLDPVTRQYNQSMKRILPKHGIALQEIPRKEYGSDVISASRVRQLLQDQKWNDIKNIVPETTYQFLVHRYMN